MAPGVYAELQPTNLNCDQFPSTTTIAIATRPATTAPSLTCAMSSESQDPKGGEGPWDDKTRRKFEK